MPSDKAPTSKIGPTQSNLPNAESPSDLNSMPPKRTEPVNIRPTRDNVNETVARRIEWDYLDLLRTVFFFSSPSVENVTIARECLELLVHFPFFLPDPIPGDSKWTDSKAAQKRLRNDFIRYLRGKNFGRQLSSFLQTQFAHFLLDFGKVNRYPSSIRSYLQKIPQKITAGRRRTILDQETKREILAEGPRVHKFVVELQAAVQSWTRRYPTIDARGVCKRICQHYPRERYPWIDSFMELADQLPRKPYPLKSDQSDRSDGSLARATLLTPRLWSCLDIGAKILCNELLRKHKTKVSARTVRNLLRKSLGNN